jgi:predicted KAP-like P-loop ATPase
MLRSPYASVVTFLSGLFSTLRKRLRQEHVPEQPPDAGQSGSVLSADDPIKKLTEDQRGRADLARSLAEALAGWRRDQSVVVALHGPWGTGKSSIKNMTLDAFTEMPEAIRPQVLEFNPWQFSGQAELFTAFFREVGTALGSEPGPDTAALERRWRVYQARLKLGNTIANALQDLLSFALVLMGGAGLAVAIAGIEAKAFTALVSSFAVAAGLLLKWPLVIAGAIGDLLHARSEIVAGVPDLKSGVAELLKKRRRPLVVILDDVDRLQPPDVRLMFQLIKANADLPRLVYFVLYQEDIIVRSLTTFAQDGGEFLEKIVQVAFAVPVLQQAQVDKALFSGLDEILEQEGMNRTFDETRWGNMYLGGLKIYFSTLRRVHRYLASLRFHAGVLRRRGALEVNVLDLIGLEALRLYEPGVYQQLHASKRYLTERAERDSLISPNQDEAKSAVLAIMERVSPSRKDAVQRIMTELFPHAAWVFGGSHYVVSWEERWDRDLRIATGRFFDRYFLLGLAEGDLSEADLNQVLASVSDRARLTAVFRSLAARELLIKTLERLEAHKELIAYENAVPFVGALLDIGDEIPPAHGGLFDIEPIMHASRIIYWFLKQGPTPERGERFLEAARTSSGFFVLTYRTQLEVEAHEKKSANGDEDDTRLMTPEQLKALISLSVQRIESAANEGRVLGHWGALRVLYVWRKFAGEESVKTWMADHVTKENVLGLLRAVTETVTSQGVGDYVSRRRRYIKLSTIGDFIPADRVAALLEEIEMSTLAQADTDAITAFREAVARHKAGKPDYDPWNRPSDSASG